MPVYSVEGKLGTGKTKFAVWRAQQALFEGRRVASNVDLKCEVLNPFGRSNYVRIPDKPSSLDLEAIGHGNPDSYDEDRNGVLILDELGTWLNARSFQDKDRAHVLDWLIHARKLGWDVYLIVQDAGMIDKQVREALIEYQVRCMRGDRIKIPILGHVLGVFNKRWAYLPKFHMATARVGYGAGAIVAERWQYVGKGLHAAYDTRQVFSPSYPHGAHCVLPPWDWKPIEAGWMAGLRRILGVKKPEPRPRPQPLPKKPLAVILARLPAHESVRWTRYCIARGFL
ncbi:zonular occludens toxin domain-containing protein [Xenophilus azovorans]|uniref:zonular occludens toxin domain-containing protein n=1 Tax=Xenophilus azovorans TaxID=151755 RepID=UPI00068EB254|nr:zonular occludens toxin domain-containing protein [Xenophilus azovorans]